MKKLKIKSKNLIILFLCTLVFYYSCSTKGYEIEETEEEYPEIPQSKRSEILDISQPEIREELKKEETPAFEPNLKEGPFTVQVGAFLKESKAVRRYNRAKNKLNSEVYYKLIDGLFKVRVGEYSTKADALIELAKIQNAGFFDAFYTQK